MNPKIEQAIREGEALLAEKQRIENEKEEQRRKEAEEYAATCRLQALAWAKDVFPKEIKERTAKGQRSYSTHSKYKAEALRLTGWIVNEYWHEPAWDEGVDFGSYWEYEITW